MINLTVELLRQGYTAEELHKLWGDNLLRVLNTVQN
ncbi:MAG: membrane dipeptidase [Butyricimonas faecihominis]